MMDVVTDCERLILTLIGVSLWCLTQTSPEALRVSVSDQNSHVPHKFGVEAFESVAPKRALGPPHTLVLY